MALVSASKYVSKPFGEYTMQVCKKTKYFNALHLLDVYNESHEEQQIRKRMIFHINRNKFMKQTYADFNYIADKKLIDYDYLNSLISQENSETDLCAIKKDIKFQYMIRKISDARGKILILDIHPMSCVRISFWINANFGNVILTHMKINYSEMLIFTDETMTTVRLVIQKESKKNPEEIISDRIAEEELGEREVRMENSTHRIDVLTPEYIIEVKCYGNRIKAIGQVFYYQTDYPDKQLWIHIFDHGGLRDLCFDNACKNNNIKLTYEPS
jgi:hypothetical protein